MITVWKANSNVHKFIFVINNSLCHNGMPPFSIKVIFMVFIWSNYWYVGAIYCPSTLGEIPQIPKTIYNWAKVFLRYSYIYWGNVFTTDRTNSLQISHAVDRPIPNKTPNVLYSTFVAKRHNEIIILFSMGIGSLKENKIKRPDIGNKVW